MKKIISLLIAMIFALNIALADVSVGVRVTTYDDGSQLRDDDGNLVGNKGYIDISSSNIYADVFVCATKDGKVKEYGMNLENEAQIDYARDLVLALSKMSFARFDSYGCLRVRVY